MRKKKQEMTLLQIMEITQTWPRGRRLAFQRRCCELYRGMSVHEAARQALEEFRQADRDAYPLLESDAEKKNNSPENKKF